jgi:hypothetical protein
MDNQQGRIINDLNWLGGVWESEGCFSLIRYCTNKRTQYNIRSIITNTDERFMGEVEKILIEHKIPYYKLNREVLDHKTRVDITISGFKRNQRFLNFIEPFIRGSKKENIQVLKKYIEYRLSLPSHNVPHGEIENQIWIKLRQLNGNSKKFPSTTIRRTLS